MFTDQTAKLLLDESMMLVKGCNVNLDLNFISEKMKTEIGRKIAALDSPSKVFSRYKNPVLIKPQVLGKILSQDTVPLKEKTYDAVEDQITAVRFEQQRIAAEITSLKEEWKQLQEEDEEEKKEAFLINLGTKEKLTEHEAEENEQNQEVDEKLRRFNGKISMLENLKESILEEIDVINKEIEKVKSEISVKSQKYTPTIRILQTELEDAKVKLYFFLLF